MFACLYSEEDEFIPSGMLAFMPRYRPGRPPIISTILCQFFDEHFEYLIEHDPTGATSRIPKTQKIHVYFYDYLPWCRTNNLAPVTLDSFYHVWRKYYRHIHMTDKQRFCHCNTCAQCNKGISRADNKTEKDLWLTVKSAHLEEIRNCRRVLLGWQEVAEQMPEHFLFLMGDRMDAIKTSLPKAYRHVTPDPQHPSPPHAFSPSPSIAKNQTNLTGVRWSLLDIMTNTSNYSFWSDQTTNYHTTASRIQADLITIDAEAKKRKECGQTWPRSLFVVEDAASDHRSSHRIAFFALMVAWGWFEEIQVIFLPTGHTH